MRLRRASLAVFVPLILAVTGCGSGGSPSVPAPTDQLSFIVQPASATVPLASTNTFQAKAYSSTSSPITYQWFRNGVAISGATSASYTTDPISLSDNGAIFTATATDSQQTATSAQATITVGPRSPLTGDLRFQQVGSATVANEGSGGGIATNVDIYGTILTSSFGDSTGSPLILGPPDYNCVPGTSTPDCSWSFWIVPLPSGTTGQGVTYAPDLVGNLSSDLASLDAAHVVTSLDIPPAIGAFASAVTYTSSNAGFTLSHEVVPPAAIESTVAADATAHRVVTAVSFDDSGQAHLLSYSWTGDPGTTYDTTTAILQPGDLESTATSLAAQGYIFTAFGGNPNFGYVLVGTKVHGDTLPRPLIIATESSGGFRPGTTNGYAPVAFVHYPSAQYPQAASNYTVVYEK